ncbi:MAG: hypothetical protein AAFR35_07265 [Pseudomonadota bacterium]
MQSAVTSCLVCWVAAQLCTAPVHAQSSLGIAGLDLRGFLSDAEGEAGAGLAGRIDVAVTAAHGFQGDFAYVDEGDGAIGRIAAHLYMAPEEAHKYGLFAFAGDVDGRSMFYGGVGAEGLIALGPRTVAEGRVGAGLADQNGLDYIFADAGVTHRLGPSMTVGLNAAFTDFDEVDFDALSTEVTARAEWSPRGRAMGLYAEIVTDDLSGPDGAAAETTLRAGLTLTLGRVAPGRPHSTLFATPDPVAPLVRRGLY